MKIKKIDNFQQLTTKNSTTYELVNIAHREELVDLFYSKGDPDIVHIQYIESNFQHIINEYDISTVYYTSIIHRDLLHVTRKYNYYIYVLPEYKIYFKLIADDDD